MKPLAKELVFDKAMQDLELNVINGSGITGTLYGPVLLVFLTLVLHLHRKHDSYL